MHICLFSITKISLGQNSLERNCWVIWWVMLSKKTTYSRKELYHFICRVTMEVLIKPPPPAYRETVEFCSIKATLWHPMCTQSRGPRKAKNTAFVRAHQDSFLWGHFGLRVPLSLYGHSTDISTGLYQSANAAVTSAKKTLIYRAVICFHSLRATGLRWRCQQGLCSWGPSPSWPGWLLFLYVFTWSSLCVFLSPNLFYNTHILDYSLKS